MHIIVKKSVFGPQKASIFVEMYNMIAKPYIDGNQVSAFDEYVLNVSGKCHYGQRVINENMTPMQFASAIGATDMLSAIVNTFFGVQKKDWNQRTYAG